MFKLIDGKSIAASYIEDIKKEVKKITDFDKKISLHIIQIGDDEASTIYANSKMKKCSSVGIDAVLHHFDSNAVENDIIDLIMKLNVNNDVTGIFIEMPLPKKFNLNKITSYINPDKDVDGITLLNQAKLYNNEDCLIPCTAKSVVELLDQSNIEISSKHCVILGRSNVVGKPVSLLLLNKNATVTICHSKTNDLMSICKQADILIVSIGKAEFIDEKYIKEGATVIDVGIHYKEVDGKNVICGDVNFESVKNHCSYITPVPGGVGAMTNVILLQNCLKAYKNLY